MKMAMEHATTTGEDPRTPDAPRRAQGSAPNEASFRAFYDRHMADVLHFLRFQVRDDDRPEVASKTFEIAARDFGKFVVPPGKERARAERNWLLTIARNASASHRQQTRQVEQLEDDSAQAPDDLERDTAAFELAVRLLWTLPENQRTLYLLHHREGWTQEEIARELQIPLGTIKTQLRAAQAALDAAIDRMCARERTRRSDYLRAIPLPFVAADGLLRALSNVEEEVDPDAAEHIRQGIGHGPASAAPSAPTPSIPPPRGSIATSAAGGVAGGKLVGALIAAAIGGAAITSLVRPPAPAPLAVNVQADVAPVLPAGTATTSSTPTTSGIAEAGGPHATSPSATTSATASIADPFRTESDAMQATRNAFAAGDFARALQLAEQHAKRYPGGNFVAEREAIAIRALAMTGRMADARARAETFRHAFPHSVLRGAVDAATGGAPR